MVSEKEILAPNREGIQYRGLCYPQSHREMGVKGGKVTKASIVHVMV